MPVLHRVKARPEELRFELHPKGMAKGIEHVLASSKQQAAVAIGTEN